MQFFVVPDQYAFVLALLYLKEKNRCIKNYCMGFILSSILFLLHHDFSPFVWHIIISICKKYTGV